VSSLGSRAPTRLGGGPPVDKADGPGGGGGRDWQLLTTARNHIVGYMVHGVLAQHGIECMIDDFNDSPGAWLQPFGDPLAPVKVYVRRCDIESASLILHEVDHKPAGAPAPGPRISPIWWGSIIGVLLAVVLLLAELSGRPMCFLGARC
jgi:hypothetical protein